MEQSTTNYAHAIHELSLIGQLNQLKEGSLSSTELTQHYLSILT